MTIAPRPCPACDSARSSRLDAYSPAGWDVVRCDACGFVYLQNPPAYEALEEDLAWERTYVEKSRRGGSTRLSALNRRLRARYYWRGPSRSERTLTRLFPTGRILDIGCGDVIRTAAPTIPYGIELSRGLHAKADALMHDRGGFCLHGAGAEAIGRFDADFLDGVILHSYLEHETNPLTVLRGMHRALRPGGKAFVRVPNFGSLNRRVIGAKWCGFRHPDHVNYFTPASLRHMASRAGFSTEILNRANLWLDDNIQAVLHRA